MTDELPDGFALDGGDSRQQAETLETLTAALPRFPLPDSLLARIQADTSRAGRLRRFAATVASLLDVTAAKAADLLDLAADPTSYGPGMVHGMSLLHVSGGPAVSRAITGFVRLEGGIHFPEHLHLGQESVLVLQGRFVEDGRVVGPGDVATQPAGSSHAFHALPGPDLVYLAVVQDGLRIGETSLLPGDPRA